MTPYRDRLILGLAESIQQRGFRDTTIADIVRPARTSRRTFYAEFASREACFAALLTDANEILREQISAAVDPTARWQTQVGQAVQAYVDNVLSEPAITVSWIRELPALGALGRQVQRAATASLTELLLQLTSGEAFQRVGAGPLSRFSAMLLLGGIRELTAAIIEDGGDLHDLTEVAVDVATAVLRPRPGRARLPALAQAGPRSTG